LREGTFAEGREGRLHFPTDDVDTWEILLYWAIKRTMPHASNFDQDDVISLLIRCWVLGDKYQVQTFQNEVILELLRITDGICVIRRADLKLGVELTSPGSTLRRMISEEFVAHLYHTEGDPDFSNLNDLDGNGFIEDLLEAAQARDKRLGAFSGNGWFGCFSDGDLDTGPGGIWREYMVGDHVPRRAWRWDNARGRWTF